MFRQLMLIGTLLGTLLSVPLLGHTQTAPMGDEAYGLLKQLHAYDADFPLNARTVGYGKVDEHPLERFVFDSFHHGAVPGWLAKPANADGPVPVVMLLHGLNGNKQQWLGDTFTHGGEITRGLLEEGYAVLALDAQYHGERAVYNDYVNPAEMIFQRQWAMRYTHMLLQSVVDYRRAIDYLTSRGDIDAARVGVTGYSMGGHMTFILGAVEPRVQASVACVVPATVGMPTAALTFARDMGSDPLLMMMAENDQFYSVEQAQALFDAVPGDNKTLRLWDSGHSLPAAYTGEVVDWLSEHL